MIKYHVKSLIGYTLSCQYGHLNLCFEQFEIKPWLDLARTLNDKLIGEHGYEKYVPHIDLFELSVCDHYLSIDAFGRLSRKYLQRSTPPKWQILTRLVIMSRLEDLHDVQSKERQVRLG